MLYFQKQDRDIVIQGNVVTRIEESRLLISEYTLQPEVREEEKLISMVKSYEGPEILRYWQSNVLVCQCIIDASRGHETPGSDTKDLVSAEAVVSELAFLLEP